MADEKIVIIQPVEIIEDMIKGRYKLLPASRAAAVAQGIIDRLKHDGYEIKETKDDDDQEPHHWLYGMPFLG